MGGCLLLALAPPMESPPPGPPPCSSGSDDEAEALEAWLPSSSTGGGPNRLPPLSPPREEGVETGLFTLCVKSDGVLMGVEHWAYPAVDGAALGVGPPSDGDAALPSPPGGVMGLAYPYIFCCRCCRRYMGRGGPPPGPMGPPACWPGLPFGYWLGGGIMLLAPWLAAYPAGAP